MARLTQVAQRAIDLSRAADFYSRLLGSEPIARFDPPGLVFFDLDGVRLLLDCAAPSAMLYLSVTELETTIERLRSEGVEVASEPHVIYTHGDPTLGPRGSKEWQAFIKDSEGNLVGLIEMVQPS